MPRVTSPCASLTTLPSSQVMRAANSAAAGLGGGEVETAMRGPVADGRRNAPIIDHFRAADAYWRASHEHAGPVSDAGVPGTAAPAGLAAVERAPAARMPPAAG